MVTTLNVLEAYNKVFDGSSNPNIKFITDEIQAATGQPKTYCEEAIRHALDLVLFRMVHERLWETAAGIELGEKFGITGK